MKKILFFLLILMAFQSCNPVPESISDNYVVEAYVYAGEPVRDIAIKELIPLEEPEGESDVIETADVVLSKGGSDYPLSYNAFNRRYRYEGNNLEILPQETLELRIDVNGRIATGTTTVPTTPVGLTISKEEMVIPEIKSAADFLVGNPLEGAEVTVTWSNPGNELHYTSVEFRSNLLKPILPPDVQEVVDGIIEDFGIITTPGTDTTLTVMGATLPSYGLYIVKVYKVNQEYADLYESETQDSRELNEPPSNIINARGIFSAFASDSIFFEVVKP